MGSNNSGTTYEVRTLGYQMWFTDNCMVVKHLSRVKVQVDSLTKNILISIIKVLLCRLFVKDNVVGRDKKMSHKSLSMWIN